MEKTEFCGVFGVSSSSDSRTGVARIIYQGLLALQHRGQESAGISVLGGSGIRTRKGLGLVSDVFDSYVLTMLDGWKGVGHVRYSTYGASKPENIQPVEFNGRVKFTLCFNGTIANCEEIREELECRGYVFRSTSDVEAIGYLIADRLRDGASIAEAVSYAVEKLRGGFSVLLLSDRGELIAFRDPYGFKPLSYGYIEDTGGYVVASETAALDSVGARFTGDVAPGSAVFISDNCVSEEVYVDSGRHAHCMFEWVYFSRPDSTIENVSVYRARYRLGEALAELFDKDVDVVIPVPETSRIAALGFSQRTGLPLAEGFGVNRYVWRTFIMPNDREDSVYVKFNPIKEVVKGSRVVVIDDSIVRGTTSRFLISLLRRAGAREVHLAVTCPPITSPCYMGIDFPTYKELIASTRSVEEVRRIIGADSLTYMTVDKLVESIGLPECELCLACLTGEYPIDVEPKLLSERWVKR